MNSVLTVTENHLPLDFKNVMLKPKCTEQIIIRSNVQNIEEIKSWVAAFSLLTNTKWNAETSVPEGKAMLCRKRYVCHHSDFQKISPEKNKRGSSKNTACRAKLNCKIKRSTASTRKTDSHVKQGLCAIITVDVVHNHTLFTAEALYFLPASKEVEQRFNDHFNAGMGIAESMEYHRGVLELDDEYEKKLVNNRLNPSYRTIRYWYDNWRALNSSPRTGDDLSVKLREKEKTYAEEGHTIKFSEDPFAVVILTPLMKRAHKVESSKHIVFSESTSSSDAEKHTVTFFLTPCPAGAAPLAIVITRGQSEESYKSGFQLLKTTLIELGLPAFGGQGFPKFFLTDNNASEMNALNSVWPESQNLLSEFHLLQAVWRWLCDGSNASRKERQMLLRSFREMIYATLPDLPTKYEKALSATENTKWKSYISEYWLIKEKWILSYRDHSVRGNRTNNFVKVSVRIFKDNILSRVRAYNVIGLIDFCCSALEKFYVNKFKDFSNLRRPNARLFFSKMIRKSGCIRKKDIVRVDEDTFTVPSQSGKGMTYTVNTDVGVCSCAGGKFDRFCKHEAAIYKYYDVRSVNFPPTTQKHRYEMALLANETLSEAFCQPLRSAGGRDQRGFLFIDGNEEQISDTNSETDTECEPDVIEVSEDEDEESKKALQLRVIELFSQKLSTIHYRRDDLLSFMQRLEKVSTEGQLSSFLCSAGSQEVSLRSQRFSAVTSSDPLSSA